MKIDKVMVGRMLMQLRGERTQKEVAMALKISEPAIRYYESGKRIPNDDLKVAIANYFDKTVSEIFFAYFKRIDHDPSESNPWDEPL